MKYVATIRFCAQVSPDDWETQSCHLEVSSETTIREIQEWIQKHNKRLTEFTVRELEEVLR